MAAEAVGFDSARTLVLTAVQRWKSGFIANPVYDALFFMFSPLLGLGLAFVVAGPTGPHGDIALVDPRVAYWGAIWIYAHLCAVVFRSHLNRNVFSRHRGRFIAVPLLLYAGMVYSRWIFAIGFVLTTYWDVYHTSAQNFGFCRIYDAKQGNAPEQGRGLDFWLNHVIYIGPILGGLNLIPHLIKLNGFKMVGVNPATFIASIIRLRPLITEIVVVGGLTFIGFYLYSYWRLSQQGYRVSPQKICLLVSAAAASIFAWGFLPPVRAFFMANFFHALQYFAIVWWTEKTNIRRTFGLARLGSGLQLALLGFVILVAAMGIGYHYASTQTRAPWLAIPVVISLMHFWYDGFVWSVRQHQVG